MRRSLQILDDWFFAPKRDRRSWPDLLLLAGWIALAGFQIARHVMWRDEVRALTIALNGDDLIAMLKGLHGEGHPALWYLLLRGAHAVFGRVEVLPGVAFVVGLLTVALLIFRSPFPRPLILLITSHALLFEYVVMARNYGISALFLFAIAACYPVHRDRGLLLGALSFLLANTNVVGAIMVGAFLLFWLLDLLEAQLANQPGWRWSPQLTNFTINAIIATIGVAICAVTMLPTYNDAAARDWSHASPLAAAALSLVNPGATSLGALFANLLPGIAGSVLLFGATLGLLPRRPAFLAAIAALLLTSLFFAVAANGAYRHAAVWLCFLITLYWIGWGRITATSASRAWHDRLLPATGRVSVLLVLAIQSAAGINDLRNAATGAVASRSADLGRLIASRPDLANAVILSEPEYLVEALPYYIKNPLYLARDRKFGSVVIFSRKGRMDSDLGETLRLARALRETSGVPVLILLAYRLDEVVPDRIYDEGKDWRTFRASAAEISDFRAATTMLRRFGPAKTDESFDVYLLN
ncbi:hypothetical protein FBZ93_102108 [Bradyrhizobium macuxiense]|uniref:Glycosyltransferase RgtA/B/C/D-like domain-containing protein n=1 Tax=Bradyrhizobium macuxiense TaxID=1755647 RepID=A0A560MEX0_9BRAD|nr:hypothetical protein [Bradyrhizobium macuxiense]TWC05795.1 hypothetical protein FBZ93_102108 [Bradyrhizobium macuxiense]